MDDSFFATEKNRPPKRTRMERETDVDEVTRFSFYSYARLENLSTEALEKLAMCSVQQEIYGSELCDLFNRLTVYTRKMKAESIRKRERRVNMRSTELSGDIEPSVTVCLERKNRPPIENQRRRRNYPSHSDPPVITICDSSTQIITISD
ncbi:hypothetical protein PFISCL1PPCAC_12397, partial [Pristionchus fissidentatus]